MDKNEKIIEKIRGFAQLQLDEVILPYWINNTVDEKYGGFTGRIDSKEKIDETAEKGLILNARILWTYSYAAGKFKKPEYSFMANRAYAYLVKYFYDKEYKGFYWSVDYMGAPKETKKQIYAQAFLIYAFSEYYMLTYLQESLDLSIETFKLIMKYSFDKEKKGYFEAFSREWKILEDLRLSDKDRNEKKTMNTHLHVLEAFTNLYRIYKDDKVKNALTELLETFSNRIINSNDWHFDLFFDENWERKSNEISFGHDIEGSWLLHEAAEALGDSGYIQKFEQIALKMADACIPGINKLGGLIQDIERGSPLHSDEIEWWVQSEAVVGFINAFKISGDEKYLNIALKVVGYIDKYVSDKKNGEWHHKIKTDGSPVENEDKAGFWKCPYHNSRMCFEILARL